MTAVTSTLRDADAAASGPADRQPTATLPPVPNTAPITAPIPTLAVTLAPVPIPVAGPFIGLVCAVLSVLVGGWLLLAPFAFDYRAGAARLPRPALVDLSTGAAIAAIGLLAALLFGGSIASRLRPAPAHAAAGPEPEPESEPESAPEAEAEPGPTTDSDSDLDLRDLLAPLVAALTADLQSRQEPGR